MRVPDHTSTAPPPANRLASLVLAWSASAGGRLGRWGAGSDARAVADESGQVGWPYGRSGEGHRGASSVAAALTLAATGEAQAARECEGPGINHLPSPAQSDEVLSVLAYNVYLLPSHVRAIPFMGERFAIAQEERAALIPPFLAPYDVVILSEAYDDGARATLLDGLKAQGFGHMTQILGSACRAASSCEKGAIYDQPPADGAAPRGGEGDTWFGEDGGVLIASKHPISAAREWVYADCVEPDCNAAKGFVYARIDKGSQRYHVIGTHAQFGWSGEQREAKAAQLRAIRQFIEGASGIPYSGSR